MLGFLGIFGRSRHLRRLEQRLHQLDLHPKLVPDAVKLTVMKQLMETYGSEPREAAIDRAAELLAYCVLGEATFADRNGEELAEAADRRIALALESGDGLDARLILLALYAGLAHPDVVDRHGLRAE